jgi:CHAT domain-containing protein
MLGALLIHAAVVATAIDDPRALAAAAIEAANEWKLDVASENAQRAYAMALACDDLAGQALAVDASAVVARLRGDRIRALSESTLALALAQEAGDLPAQARAWNNLGRIDAELTGDLSLARQNYRAALDLAVRANDLPLRARVLNNIGNLDRAQLRRTEALNAFRSALRIGEQTGDDYIQLAAEHNMGLLFAEQNDPSRALTHLQRAFRIEKRSGSAAAARTLLSIAEAHRALGERAQAARYLALARGLATQKRDDATVASILLREADLAIDAKRFQEAASALRRSRAISARLADRATIALADAYDAKLALSQGKTSLAEAAASRAAAAATALQLLDVVAQSESIRGIAALQSGARDRAHSAFDAAIRAVEQQRSAVAGGALARQRYFGRELFPYEQIIAVLADAGDAETALRYVEMKRARIVTETSRATTRRAESIAGAIVSYAMAGNRVVAIIEIGGALRILTLPASRRTIAAKANQFAARLAQRDNAFLEPARELYDLIWQPLELAGVDRVRVVPDEELWRVPFAALRDASGRFLAESVTISYAPAVIAIADDRPSRPRSLLLADNLPAHPTEIGALAVMYRDVNTQVIESADETAVKRALPQFDIVHIAAHGVFDNSDPLESYLQLRPAAHDDGRLTARELMTQSLSASMIVLSSCDSASGSVAAGEGLISMTWAALVAGSRTIVASQWQVASKTTTEIMIAFHRELRSGKSVAESLRAAQMAAARRVESAHPYYWAPFVVVGR